MANPPWKNNENARNVQGLWVFDAAWEGGGGKWAFTFGVTIRNCRYHDNGGPGIWFDAENRSSHIENNEVYNNVGTGEDWQGMGISNEINFGPCTITGNYVHDNSGSNIAVQESTDTTITGNWVVNGGIELRAMTRDPGIKNVKITGNFFKNSGVFTSTGSWSKRSPELRQITVDGNTYDNTSRFGGWGGTEYKSLDELRSELNFEKNGKIGTFDLPQMKPLKTPATTRAAAE
jgi:parallel beta helix pectate lyase-like protein